jgi:hypothetical protein
VLIAYVAVDEGWFCGLNNRPLLAEVAKAPLRISHQTGPNPAIIS